MKVVHTMTTANQFNDFKTKLKQLKSIVDCRYLIESLGFEIDRETSKEIRSECKIHGGDNKTAFRFNKETKSWICFTGRCHEIHGSDIIGLIQATSNLDFMGAVDYLKDLVGDVGDLSYKALQYELKREKETFIDRYKKNEVGDSIVTEECLGQFKAFRSNYFIEEGFSKETLDHFEIAGGYTDKYGYIRDIIPIRDVDGELVAYSLRDIRPDVSYDRKYILSSGFNKDSVLYNLYNAKKYLENGPLIIVEGFKAVWRLHSYHIPNVVAIMGNRITPGQQNLLYSYATKGVITMFDNDSSGVKGTAAAYKELSNKLNVIPIFITEVDENGKGLDPADLSKEQVYNYLGIEG